MKKILVIFLFSILIPTQFSSALVYSPSLGSQSNPIYIQVEQDPSQLLRDARNKINSMQRVSACSERYDSVMSLARNNSGSDMGNPAEAKFEANYLDYLYSSYQLCVSHAAQAQNQYIAPQPQKATVQDVLDGVCQKTSGINSYYANETDVSKGGGVGGCGCKAGFQFDNVSYGQCVSIPTKTNDQICQDNYGLNSNWNGTKNNGGGLVCDCGSGYQWNTTRTSCVVTLVTTNTTVISGGGGGGGGSIPQNSGDFDIKDSDIIPIIGSGILSLPSALRKCPSTNCSIIRYYAETSELNIIGATIAKDWYRVSGTSNTGDKNVTGWVHKSVFGSIKIDSDMSSTSVSIENKSIDKEDSSSSTVITNTVVVNKGFWARLWGWLGL